MALEPISEFPPPLDARKETRLVRPLGPRRPRLHFPSELPFEEHVAETKRHLEARTTLYLVLMEAFKDYTIGSDQFLYYDRTNPKKCLAPDVFVRVASRVADFDSWKMWKRGVPDLAVEIFSGWDRLKLTWEEKFERYQATGIRELIRFDLTKAEPIQVWDRIGTTLIERSPTSPNARKCKTLGLYWVVETHPDFGPQLRLARDFRGKDLLPTPTESMLRLARDLAAERTARAEAEHEKLVAEHQRREEAEARAFAEEQKRAAEEQKRIAEEQKRAAEEQKRAAEEQKRAAEEQKRAAEEQLRLADESRRVAMRKQKAAQKKQKAEAAARAQAEEEVKRLREEVERLRKSR
jgi:Putative restriction endonuclease